MVRLSSPPPPPHTTHPLTSVTEEVAWQLQVSEGGEARQGWGQGARALRLSPASRHTRGCMVHGSTFFNGSLGQAHSSVHVRPQSHWGL